MFNLNFQGGDPLYEQIRLQIIRFIDIGILKANDRLPSVRQLAQDNGINPNTVAKAYQELEKDGVIYTVPKKGVYVSGDVKEKELRRSLISFFTALKEKGTSQEEIMAVLREVYQEEKC